MKEKILMICKEICCDEISEDTQLITSGLFDSYMVMELIDGLENEFKITLIPEEIMNLDNFSCVNYIADFVDRKLKAKLVVNKVSI